jgi:hypothetical protein
MSQITLLHSLNLLLEHKYYVEDLHYICKIAMLLIIAMQYIVWRINKS